MKSLISLLVFVSLLFPLTGCSKFTGEEAQATKQQIVDNAYATLETAAIVYNTSMTAVSQAQMQGIITAEQREQINDIGTIYFNSYQLAVVALHTFKTTDDALQSSLVEAIDAATANLNEFLKLAVALGVSIKDVTVPEMEVSNE